jgi:lipopolysaccharide transport system ATP-binding protein
MSDLAITARGLGKQYRIGQRFTPYRTLRETIMRAVKAPFRAIRRTPAQKRLRKRDNTIWALQDVTFDVREGEVVGIIGKNGAGKSTLLKVLSRITEPTRGYAEIRGRVGVLLEVGTGFHPELTGRENIYLNGAVLGMTRREIGRRFDEIVAFSEIEKFIDTPAKYYSSGMYIRLAFAVAAHLEPDVLIVDEVLAVGDVAFQKKCLGKMGEVAEEGRTILFVSHNMAAVRNLCQRAYLLDHGAIVEEGDTDTVITSYLNRTSEGARNGYADLQDVSRHEKVAERPNRVIWVRTLDRHGEETGAFFEGDPITVEVGFALAKGASSVQLGCGVSTADVFGRLFTVPSPEWGGRFPPGEYTSRLRVDPNFLRPGMYVLSMFLFSNGHLDDGIKEAIHVSIGGNTSDDIDTTDAVWVRGPMQFDYQWEGAEAVDGAGRRRRSP